MKLIAFILSIFTILLSCNTHSKNDQYPVAKDNSQVNDTITVSKDSIIDSTFADSLLSGAYLGIFPCPDCDGIQQTILFNPDKTYEEEQTIWGRNESPRKTSGLWEMKDRNIELSQANKTVMILVKKEDTLFATNINGIELNNSSKYYLTKRTLARDNPIWAQKQKKGIDFAGLGNEPFWNLEINNKKSISFKLAAWKKPITVPIQKPLLIKDSMIYHLKTDTINWTIKIFPRFCGDGMSDYLYQYKVYVKYNGFGYKGCGVMLAKEKFLLSLR